MMDSEVYRRQSLQYKILEKIGFDEYQIKIWIMSHMDMQDEIDAERFGKFSCKSFMKKDKSYKFLMQQVDELVNRKVLFVVDRHESIKRYRFTGESQYDFQKLVLGASEQFRNRGSSELSNLFRDCLKEENEPDFINTNHMEFFEQTRRDPKKIKEFLTNFLIANASAYALFLLSLL